MDDAAYRIMKSLQLPGIHPISLEEFEHNDEPLKIAKTNRSRIEYYFTCSPSLPLYVLNKWSEVTLITYLDADMFFFNDPSPLFDELGVGSISIIAHKYPPSLKDKERFGIYNVGWLSFRRDAYGLACLRWWRDRCIEWCYDRLEEGKYADQKYLDDWPDRFENVVVIEHKGANLAPWNLANYHLCSQNGRTTVDNQRLIFFHFHGLKQITGWCYAPRWKVFNVTPSKVLRRNIYIPYIRTLFNVSKQFLPSSEARPLLASVRGGLRKKTSQEINFKYFAKQLRILPSLGWNILIGRYLYCSK